MAALIRPWFSWRHPWQRRGYWLLSVGAMLMVIRRDQRERCECRRRPGRVLLQEKRGGTVCVGDSLILDARSWVVRRGRIWLG